MGDTSEKPVGTDTQTTPTRGGGLFWFLEVFFLFMVIYPLSIGPAAIMHDKHAAARPAIEAVYKPVTALADYSPRVQNLLLWYLWKAWGFPPPAPPTPLPPTLTPITNSDSFDSK